MIKSKKSKVKSQKLKPQIPQLLNSLVNFERISAYPYPKSFNLNSFKGFLRFIGGPQDCLRCIHIAGSKGKGSTAAFIAYILREAGYRVGLYTSPHLSDFRERFRILDQKSKIKNQRCKSKMKDFEGMISKKELNGLVEKLKPAMERFGHSRLTFFEACTALAFEYFKKKRVDFAVLETGLGGRLDATNAAQALVSVITPISYEHTQVLGKTLKQIAGEKAGIIKENKNVRIKDAANSVSDEKKGTSVIRSGAEPVSRPMVVVAPQQKEAMKVIRQRCKKVGAKLVAVKNPTRLQVSLIGEHQKINAAVAIKAIESLRNFGVNINQQAIKRGLVNTVWPGRCEVLSRRPLVVLDGAQNTASARALVNAVKSCFVYKRLILVLGISADKDIEGICRVLGPLADEVVVTASDNPRAAKPKDLALSLAPFTRGKAVHLTKDTHAAEDLACRLAGRKDLILVTGSLFLVGDFLGEKSSTF